MKKMMGLGLIAAFLFPSVISVSTSFAAAAADRSPLPDQNLPGTTHQNHVASVACRERKRELSSSQPFSAPVSNVLSSVAPNRFWTRQMYSNL